VTHQPAPIPQHGETPQAYVLRVCEYLTEPDRRRLGVGTAHYVEQAVAAISSTAPSADALQAALAVAALQRIEDMVAYDDLRDALVTVDDLADRIQGVLKDAKMWWTP